MGETRKYQLFLLYVAQFTTSEQKNRGDFKANKEDHILSGHPVLSGRMEQLVLKVSLNPYFRQKERVQWTPL